LILDNADDPRFDYSEYFPPGTRGTVIMTSRIPECRKYSTVEPEALEGLELTHSTKLLLKAAQVLVESWPSYTAPAQEIVQLLGSHTLAIIQAGAYIAGGYCRLSQYPERYRQQRKKLLEHYPDQERSRYQNVYATFEASVEVLKLSKDEAGKDALELLAILSVLHSSVFPLALFKDTWAGARACLQVIPRSDALPKQHLPWRLSWRIGTSRKGAKQADMSRVWKEEEIIVLSQEHAARLPGLVGPEAEEWDDYRLRKASALLASLSLVTRHLSDDFDGLSMHPLAHAWAKDRLEKGQQQNAWTSAACLVAFSRKISGLWQEHGRMLQPHMQSLIPLNPEVLFSRESHRLMLPIVMNCGWLLHFLREDRKLHSLLEGIYQELGITPWAPSEEYLSIWTLASRNQLCLHNTKLAIVLLEYVTKAEKIMLMDTDPERLISHYNLACAYSNDGQFERAIPILEHVAKVYETALPGDTHSFWLLSSQIELARAYNATGRNESGVALLEHVVKLQEAAPTGVNLQRLLAAKHSLATAYNANKQTKEAVALLEEVTKVYESTLEETHIARLSSQYELARSYLRDEKVSKALVLLEHVVNVQKSTLGENHPTQIASQFMLAMAYKTNKQIKEARELLEHVVRISEKVLDEKHPDRLVSEFQLALAYMNDGEREKATTLMEHVVEMCTTTLVSAHPLRKQSEEALADFTSGTIQGRCS
jgi:tetratricopeptide (TPR) repeat protein